MVSAMKNKRILTITVIIGVLAAIAVATFTFSRPTEIKVDLQGTEGLFVAGTWQVDGKDMLVATTIPYSFTITGKCVNVRLVVPNGSEGNYCVQMTAKGKILKSEEAFGGYKR